MEDTNFKERLLTGMKYIFLFMNTFIYLHNMNHEGGISNKVKVVDFYCS